MIVATTGLVVAYVVSRLFHYDAGTAAGVIAGSLTESATIGTASDAIARLRLADADALAMTNRIPVAFAVTYLIGVVGAAWFLAQLAPRIMRVDLAEECRHYEQQMRGGGRRHRRHGGHRVSRVCRAAGITVHRAQPSRSRSTASDARLFVERIRRADRIIDADGSTVIQGGDTLAITGRREWLSSGSTSRSSGFAKSTTGRFSKFRPRCSTSSSPTPKSTAARSRSSQETKRYGASICGNHARRHAGPIFRDARAAWGHPHAGGADTANRAGRQPHRDPRSGDRRHRYGAGGVRHRRRSVNRDPGVRAGGGRNRVEPQRGRTVRRPCVRMAPFDVAAIFRPYPKPHSLGLRIAGPRRLRRRSSASTPVRTSSSGCAPAAPPWLLPGC